MNNHVACTVLPVLTVLMELEIGCHASAPAMTPPLEPPDSMYLRAAQGWLELGNHLEANEELERIAPELRAHPDVLEVRWHIYAQAKKWDVCVDLAGAIIKLDRDRAEPWIHRSFALHELKRTQEAFDQLLPVADRFPQVWTIPYNLAGGLRRRDTRPNTGDQVDGPSSGLLLRQIVRASHGAHRVLLRPWGEQTLDDGHLSGPI